MRLAPGQTVSHYRILDVLGEGGMGIVYRAQDLKLPREVALKFLPDDLVRNSDAKKRFVNEAKTASSLQHPNICTIFDIDETAKGHTFIVMPRYYGETLRARLDRIGHLETADAMNFTSQLADGLARAHDKGIVHRDIKPENVFITDDGTAILMDFGLAKLAGTTKITRTGKTLGTMSYMSPEQATGAEVDRRSDIFSLGVVLFELLTNRLPFKGEHEAAILYGIVHNEPEPVTSYRNDVPPGLPAVVGKALKKRPDERYQSAVDLKSDLARIIGSGELAPKRPFAAMRSHRTLAGFSALVVIAAAGVVAWNLWIKPVEAEVQALAIIDFRELAEANDDMSGAGITELVNVGLIESSPVRLISTEYLQDLRRRRFGASGAIADDQALEVARESGATLLLAGSIGKSGNEPFVTWRLVDVHRGTNLAARTVRGADLARVADQIVAGALVLIKEKVGIEGVNPVRPVSDMTTASPEAYQHYLAGLKAVHEARTEASIEDFEKAVALDSTFALAQFELSRAQDGNNQRAANTAAVRAWSHRSRLGIKDRLRLEAWREQLSSDYSHTTLENVRELAVRWPEDREILYDLAWTLLDWNHFDEAARTAERGEKLYPDDLDFLALHASALDLSGRRVESLRVQQELTAREPNNPNYWDEIGHTFLRLGLPDSAEASFNKALTIDSSFLSSLTGLAKTAYCRGNINEAIERTEAILRSPELAPDTRAGIQGGRYMSLAFYYSELGCINRALAVNSSALSTVSITRSRAASQLALFEQVLFLEKNDRAGAIACNRRAEQYVDNKAVLSWFNMDLFTGLDSLVAARAELDRSYYPNRHRWGPDGYSFFLFRKAKLLLREQQPDSALKYFKEAEYGSAFQNILSFLGLEFRTEKARALRLAGRPQDAARVIEEQLRICRGHALGHYELGKLYEVMKRPADAKREYGKFLEMWAEADDGLPQVIDARQRLRALGG